MQTLGSLIDQLSIVNLKTWNAQENLYDVRRMTLEEFKQKFQNNEGIEILYNYFTKICDLNLQRNTLIDEIDDFIINMIKNIDTGIYKQNKHKSF